MLVFQDYAIVHSHFLLTLIGLLDLVDKNTICFSWSRLADSGGKLVLACLSAEAPSQLAHYFFYKRGTHLRLRHPSRCYDNLRTHLTEPLLLQCLKQGFGSRTGKLGHRGHSSRPNVVWGSLGFSPQKCTYIIPGIEALNFSSPAAAAANFCSETLEVAHPRKSGGLGESRNLVTSKVTPVESVTPNTESL